MYYEQCHELDCDLYVKCCCIAMVSVDHKNLIRLQLAQKGARGKMKDVHVESCVTPVMDKLAQRSRHTRRDRVIEVER